MNEKEIISKQLSLLDDRQMFDIEITTRCNKHCYICPRDNFQRKNQNMSPETFEKVCEWLPADCNVFFAGYGEPLLHKNCLEFISKLHQKDIRTSIYTNGSILTKEIVNQLFETGLFKLQISILLKNEMEKIAELSALFDVSQIPNVRFNILYENSMQKPLNLSDILKSKGFEVEYKLIHNRGNELYHDVFNNKLVTCASFFAVNYIDTDGDLQVCCNDINGRYNLSSILKHTFEEYSNMKKQYIGNKQIIPICKNCIDEYRLKHFKI